MMDGDCYDTHKKNPSSDSSMSDSVKLRFEHGILCMIFSYLSLIACVACIFISAIPGKDYKLLVVLAIIFFVAFALLFVFTIVNFEDAINVSKKEKN